MAEISNNNTCLSGEYFVAAELYRRNWSVGLTLGNAKKIDLFAEKNGITIQVQVKSLFKRKHGGWVIKSEQVKCNCWYIFVLLNGDTMLAPQYFIATSEEAFNAIADYTTRSVLNISKFNSLDFINRWDKLESH